MAFCGSAATCGTRPETPGWNMAVAIAAQRRADDDEPQRGHGRTERYAGEGPPMEQDTAPRRRPIIRGRGWNRSASTPPNTTKSAKAPIQAARANPTALTP